eukprot:NODE_183_length_13752_cov_1.079103.p4 type:complete len:256 gc:universal NODE_183_length_13752_cov_1.079103:3886-4653(+)
MGHFEDYFQYILTGMESILFIITIVMAYYIFPQKIKPFYIILNIALISTMITALFATPQLVEIPTMMQLIIQGFFWHSMIFFGNWAYSRRILTLGIQSQYDKLVKLTPYILIIITTPTAGLVTGFVDFKSEYLRAMADISFIVFSVCMCIVEFGLFAILLQKVFYILEYRVAAKRKIRNELIFSLILLIIIETGLVVSIVRQSAFAVTLRPLTYFIRLLFLIRFYSGLMDSLDQPIDLRNTSKSNDSGYHLSFNV